jgi:methyl acetate hydrolase
MTIDAVGWIASMSKLITSVSAMQLVEKGQIKLDDDVGKFVPQLSNIGIVTGVEDGQLKMRKQSKPIMLRYTEPSP